jgi:predicted dehydrogenase
MALRVAVIGCGTIARALHVPALLAAGADVSVFASRSRASAQAAADEAGGGEVHADWREAVARPDVDAVVVCTPNVLHAPIAVAAAQAGKHVLVEKPFATTVADVDAMIAAAEAAGVVLMAAHNVRFAPPFPPMRDAIAAGRIGAVTSVRVAFCHSGPQRWAPQATWFRMVESAGGGALMDLGVHVADTLRFVLADEFVEVTATVDALPIDEDAVVGFRLASGAIGSVHVGWRSVPAADQSIVVHGTEGTLRWDLDDGVVLDLPDLSREPLPMAAEDDNPGAAFVRAATGGGAPIPSAQDGRAAVAFVTAAYEAARTGSIQQVER